MKEPIGRAELMTGTLGGDGVTEPPPTDAILLGEFADRRDPAALELLVRRHGPMVYGVCRRVATDPHDAEDAFQATFLVLVRRASGLRRPERLANWLYGVALRVARKARDAARKRRGRQEPLADVPAPEPAGDWIWRDLRAALDAELSRLPEKYRAPVVLCHLEGHTLDETARHLGWPKGTVAGRLSRARALLRGRLARRGVTMTAAALGLALAESARAAVPPPLLAAAASGRAAAGAAALAAAAGRPAAARTATVVAVLLGLWLAAHAGLSALAADGVPTFVPDHECDLAPPAPAPALPAA